MQTKASRNKGGRPRQSVHKKRVNITLHPEVLDKAGKIAFSTQRSLSGLIENSLLKVIRQFEDRPDTDCMP